MVEEFKSVKIRLVDAPRLLFEIEYEGRRFRLHPEAKLRVMWNMLGQGEKVE